MKYKYIFAAAMFATAPVLASAGTIDFTDSATYAGFSSPASSITGTVDGVGFTVTGTPDGQLNFSQAYDGDASATLLAEDIDGLGVGDDEISNANGKQVVTVEFASPVSIVGLHFLDLFLPPGVERPSDLEDQTLVERMQVWINTTDFSGQADRVVKATAGSGDPTGYKFDDFSSGPVTGDFDVVSTISFTSSRGNDAVGVADGALAGIDLLAGGSQVAPIPLPASILLLLGGLGSFSALRRRKTA